MITFALNRSKIFQISRLVFIVFAGSALLATMSCWAIVVGFLWLVFLVWQDKGESSIGAILFSRDEKLWFLQDHESKAALRLRGSSIMLRHMVILHFEVVRSKRKKQLIIFSDQLPEAAYRRLRFCVAYLCATSSIFCQIFTKKHQKMKGVSEG